MTTTAGSLLRLGALVLVVGFLVLVSGRVSEAVMELLSRQDDGMILKIIVVGLLTYVATMALPFMPGVEIGLALLTAFGATVAPAVYLATITALGIAFSVGRFVPCNVTARWLAAVGLKRGAAMVRQLGDEPPADAAAFIASRTQNRLIRSLVRHRYIALALLLNLPGNVVIGGGGGIALAAGLSRTFHPALFFLTVAIAVLPVPLTFLLAGGR